MGLTKKEKEKREKYKEALEQLIIDVGDWNVNILALSREWGVPNTTLDRWRDKILQKLPDINPKETGKYLMRGLESAFKQAQLKAKGAKREIDRARYFQVMTKLGETLTSLYEKYGKKQIMAYRVEVEDKTDYSLAAACRDVLEKKKKVVKKKK